MNTTDFLAMQSGYSARTRGAKHVIDASFPLVERALSDILEDFKAPIFGLADYGAADAGTSSALILKTIDTIREKYPNLPIHLNYSDLPENDFNAIARMLGNLKGEGKSIVEYYEHLTASTTPFSFYQPILPANMLTLGYSATAMHWLAFAPTKISDHVHIAASKDEEAKQAYRAKSHQDLVKILRLRATEMQRGGYFLMVNFGINDQGEFLGNTTGVPMFNHFYTILSKMVEEGEIQPHELENMNFPQYYRKKEDYHNAVKDETLNGKLELVEIQDLKTPCPYREDFKKSGDKELFISSYPETLQTWSTPVFFVGLDPVRPLQERQAITKAFFNWYKNDIENYPEEHGMDYVHHLILFKRI